MRGEHGPGDRVGRYCIVRTIGRGGMGITYEAQPVNGGPSVALKELRLSHLDDWKSVELFKREADVLASVRHPAVPYYVDHFTVESGEGPVFYIVQQFAPGRSLADLVASGWRADELEAKRIAEALLDVLDALHARVPPVYHRDIKPQNVLREDGGKIWLVDFGAVRDVYRSTTVGGSTVAGTFGYMAPEQLHGVARPESDLYGLGATLIYVLSGLSPADMPQRKLRPDFRSRVSVSRGFAAWLEKMLEPAPEDRFRAAVTALKAMRDPRSLLRTSTSVSSRTLWLGMGLALIAAPATFVAFTETRQRGGSLAFTGSPRIRTAADGWLPERPRDPSLPIGAAPIFIPAARSPVMSAAITPDGGRLLTAALDGTVKIWDAHTGKALGALAGHTGPVRTVSVSSDGRSAVTGGDTTVRTFSLPDGKPLGVIAASSKSLSFAAVSPRGDLLASASRDDGDVRIWRTADGALVASMTHPRVLTAVFAAAGAWIVTAGEDAVLRVWNVADGRLLKTLAGHGAAVGALAVAPDGVTIASASDDHMVKLWRLQTGDLLKTLSFHTDEVWSLAFSPNGGTLLSGDKAGMIAKWDIPVGILRGTMSLDPRLQATTAIAFAPDGVSFATTHRNGNAILWTLFGSGSHRTVPAPPLLESSVITGTRDQLTYARALDLIDSYHGEDHPLRDAEALLKGLLDTNSKAAALAGLSRIAFKRALINRDTFDEAGMKSALELAERSVASDPTLADGFVAKGWALHGLKDVVGARAAVETARRLAPESARVRLLEAVLTAEDGETARAEQLYGETLSRPMTRFLATVAYGYLREVYWDLGDMDAVEQCDRKAIELEPEAAWPKGNYAYFLLEKGDVEGAIGMAQAALDQMDYGMARGALADAYCAKGHEALWDGKDPEMAKRAFDNAARVGSTGACAAYGLGAYHQYLANKEGARGELLQARSAYERAAALDPKDALVQRALAALQ